MPADKTSDLYKYQHKLYNVSKDYVEAQTYIEDSIKYENLDLWSAANEYVCNQICEHISAMGCIDSINEKYNSCGEVKIYENLNALFECLSHFSISPYDSSIYPNQNGKLCAYKDLYREEGTINDLLKDVIQNLVDETEDWRNKLMDKRCVSQPEKILNSDSAYKLIDDKVYEYYQIPAKWEEDEYIEAVHLLIEVWKDVSGQFTIQNFPKTKPIEDSIVLNVVWKKEKRKLLMNVSSKLTDEQIQIIIANSAEIGELTNKVKSLEDENESLRSQLGNLMSIINKEDSETNQPVGDDQTEIKIEKVPKIHELKVTFSDGSIIKVPANQEQYAGLSLEEIVNYVSEAKAAVVKYFRELNDAKELGLIFDEKRIGMDSYSQLYGIYDRHGNEIPLVVHSYKGPQYRYFDLNWYDWQLLSKEGAMLWVMTATSGLQCIPLYALPIRNININIDKSLPLETQAALLTIGNVGKLMASKSCVQFEFGNNMPHNFNTPLAFDYVPKDIKQCISAIKEVCDTKIPAIAGMYNSGVNIPIIENTNGYSKVLKAIEDEGTMRDLHDLPDNPLEAPEINVGVNLLL